MASESPLAGLPPEATLAEIHDRFPQMLAVALHEFSEGDKVGDFELRRFEDQLFFVMKLTDVLLEVGSDTQPSAFLSGIAIGLNEQNQIIGGIFAPQGNPLDALAQENAEIKDILAKHNWHMTEIGAVFLCHALFEHFSQKDSASAT